MTAKYCWPVLEATSKGPSVSAMKSQDQDQDGNEYRVKQVDEESM